MARSNMILILACCVMLATVTFAKSDRDRGQSFRFEIYEQQDDSNELDVFGPQSNNVGWRRGMVFSKKNNDDDVGSGIVYSNRATRNEDPGSEVQATVSGLYFYTNENQVHEISSIQFEKDVDINEDGRRFIKGGRFSNSQLHLHGLWNLENREDERNQEIAIVGGSGGLAGAYGTVRYERVEGDRQNAFRVVGEFQIENNSESSK